MKDEAVVYGVILFVFAVFIAGLVGYSLAEHDEDTFFECVERIDDVEWCYDTAG